MSRTVPKYEELAHKIEEMISAGAYEPGERLPSIRDLHREFHVSVTTAREVYRLLEDRGIVEPRSHSGHFVRQIPALCDGCAMTFPDLEETAPRDATTADLTRRMIRDGAAEGAINLATAEPPASLLPSQRLVDVTARELRRRPNDAIGYSMPPGPENLRQEIAKRVFRGNVTMSPDQILVTAGCMEAVFLALFTVCDPGDAVVIESPGFYLFYRLLERLGLRAIEVPSYPVGGVDPDELDFVLSRAEAGHNKRGDARVRAVLLIPNFSNPVGSLMPDARKAKLSAVLARHDVVLIEDDIYGEMAWNVERPSSLAAFTDPARTLLCSSFSKSIAPGYRVGWVAAGRPLIEQVIRSKMVTSAAVVSPTAIGIAAFLANGGYDRWLRAARRHYRSTVASVRRAIEESFPDGTRITNPAGGMIIWIVLPAEYDAIALYEATSREGIIFAPGPVFALGASYHNCLRLNATRWNPTVAGAIHRIGELAHLALVDISRRRPSSARW
jgi:DNA-binding transcriptional MocR family regulator